MRVVPLALLLCLLLAGVSQAVAIYGEPAKRGWWWYELPAPPSEEDDMPEAPPESNESAPARLSPEILRDLHPDAFQAYMQAMEKEAVRRPTVDNVRHYYEVQNIARQKAAAFTHVAEYVWQKYPEISVAKDYPLAAPGRAALTSAQVEERRQLLAAAREDFALLYFHAPDCPFCREQEQILRYFSERFGWTVRPVDTARRPDLAARFGVETVPALLLIHRESPEYLPVAAGVTSAAEIEARLYRGIRYLGGQVGPQDFGLYDFQRGGGFDPAWTPPATP
ncbi:conjugal transfer protein TraF [Geoalkalibacter halelectricus]|uniref:Conjugal transfer protein TraF n=1 Tax=Geoalkalibacter halelectricus TaxID=2847045 RepID=A0ABY5ZP19_9BACT|nr:conjugal transfer protein TraF [Geoalkalibacter halelectricus]MDO3377161.1 conjugal transfer protein TraF [Geoalkalibacter halelectricus]UWZ79625.1 conjugal transfer protein TraF [Geoalkalibacter halelectricus]